MSKKIIVDNCVNCPFFFKQVSFSGTVYERWCNKLSAVVSETPIDETTPITIDCPLPNAD